MDFFYEDVDYKIPNQDRIISWLELLIKQHSKVPGEITYIFCSDDYLLEMNRTHLNHDYFTDIITFNYNQPGIVSGDIFISIDRVADNAKTFLASFDDEINRVMAHGVLHLIGFNDKTKEEQQQMSEKENKALKLLETVS